MISFVTNPESGELFIHADLVGLAELERLFGALKKGVAQDDCPHTHYFGPAWGGDELAESMLEQERDTGCKTIHHVKVYGWTEVWARKHGLKGGDTAT
ncbi:hypothetical protein GC170_06275 [bacterium]|nr:hypothetical protein [bacterium]